MLHKTIIIHVCNIRKALKFRTSKAVLSKLVFDLYNKGALLANSFSL